MSAKKTGLGKGFAALIPQDFDQTILVDESEKVYSLDLANVIPHAKQPRQNFDEEAIGQLAQSIKRHGVLQPIVVTPVEGNNYSIIAGERSWRASKKAGLKKDRKSTRLNSRH